jgi:branched-chain amino acid transport system permease protein
MVEAAEARASRAVKDLILQYLGVGLLILAVIWLVANFVADPGRSFTVLFQGLGNGALYALIALGYTLVYGIIELINFAHGDLFMLGSVFSGIIVVNIFGATTNTPRNWAILLVALVMVMVICGFINLMVERLAYRRLRRAPKLASLITAVGVSFIFQWWGQQSWMTGSTPKQWPQVVPSGGIKIGSVTLGWTVLLVIAVTIPLLILLQWIVTKTRQGRAMRATAQDPDAAMLMGIDVDRTIAFTFALGGAMAGAAGLLYLETIGTTFYGVGFQLGLIAFTAAVLGGIGNLPGAVIGGVLIGVAQAFNDGGPYGLHQQWSQTFIFAILILLMVFKPEGILGNPTVEKV